MTINDLKLEIIRIGQLMYKYRYSIAADGNISCKINDSQYLITTSGVCKGRLSMDDVIMIDRLGNPLNSNKQPSSESKLHLEIYKHRNDVRFICHAHPIAATTLACAGLPLDKPFLAELIITLGFVPLIRYGTPGSIDITNDIKERIGKSSALLLEKHGVATFGSSAEQAYKNLETLEQCAMIYLNLKQLGDIPLLDNSEVERLLLIRKQVYGL